ncbi:hypothetical protein H5410_055209 [Solanum commersonii]|uniref:Uncharacterized protein n=1 Tax=Solanum commersonii TaxID=4109 RepID=A0A9J5WGZ8_SOLCO|nr:hypothetical protein H5410_055209 [Solanum commersonii]
MSPQTETKSSVGFKAGAKEYKLTYYTHKYQTKDTDILAKIPRQCYRDRRVVGEKDQYIAYVLYGIQVERDKLNKYGRVPRWDVLLNLNRGYLAKNYFGRVKFMNVFAVNLILPKMMRT